MTQPFFRRYSQEGLIDAALDALRHLAGEGEGYPRNWSDHIHRRWQEDMECHTAPIIAGYEWLESLGLVVRIERPEAAQAGRVMFKLADWESRE